MYMLVTLSLIFVPNQSVEETQFDHLYSWAHHYPELMTTGAGWNADWLVNWDFCLLAQVSLHHNRLLQHSHHCWCRPRPSVNLLLHIPPSREQKNTWNLLLGAATTGHSSTKPRSSAQNQIRILRHTLQGLKVKLGMSLTYGWSENQAVALTTKYWVTCSNWLSTPCDMSIPHRTEASRLRSCLHSENTCWLDVGWWNFHAPSSNLTTI